MNDVIESMRWDSETALRGSWTLTNKYATRDAIYCIAIEVPIEFGDMMRRRSYWRGTLQKLHVTPLLRKGRLDVTGKDQISARLGEAAERNFSMLLFATLSARQGSGM